MFGYRLCRERDFDQLQEELVATRTRELNLQASLLESTRKEAAAQTRGDMLITRVNVLEQEYAALRNKLTGLPAIAPSIEKGQPLRASEIGANVDLFEDVGDEKARQLEEAGLLHDRAPVVEFPHAADLSAAATGSGRTSREA